MENLSLLKASLVLVVKNIPAMQETQWEVNLIPGMGRFRGGGCGNPLQYYCLENSMERGTWQAIGHRFAKGQTWLSDFYFTWILGASLVAQMVKNLPAMQEIWSLGQEDPLEKKIATHSSIFAWRIPCTEEPGGLQFMGKHGRHKPSKVSKCAVCWVFQDKAYRLWINPFSLWTFLVFHCLSLL